MAMTLRVHAASAPTASAESEPDAASPPEQLVVHPIADAENVTLASALEAVAATVGRASGGTDVRLVSPRDALGRAVDPSADVFSAWLEHGDQSGSFDTDLSVWVTAEAKAEASSIYDLLADD